jgi:hypothetical protein
MEPAAPNSANTDYEGLEPVIEWLKAHPDSRNDRFEGTPLALNDTSYAGPDHVADRLQDVSPDSRNEDDELTNEISPDTGTEVTITAPVVLQAFSDSHNENDEPANPVAAAASPRQRRPPNTNLDPNVRFICTHEGCSQTFGSTIALHYHEAKHKPAAFHCEQCNYSTWRKDMLRDHHDRQHKHYTDIDLLKCQKCNYQTYLRHDLRRHQERHERRHNEEKDTATFHCEQCNYSTYRKDMLKSHHDRRHKQYTDRLKCQKCNYETYHETDLRKHQRWHERQHVEETTDTRQ